MFAIPSIGKIVVLVLFICAAWKFLTYIKNKQDKATNNTATKNTENLKHETVELCGICNVYIAHDAMKNCGKKTCPYT